MVESNETLSMQLRLQVLMVSLIMCAVVENEYQNLYAPSKKPLHLKSLLN